MRRVAKVDANQAVIVRDLRKAGASVQSLATVGSGCPDLLVGFRGQNILMECKDGRLSRSKRALTDDQREWIARWYGSVYIVNSPEEALTVLKLFGAP